jgi:hypothetical protein
MEIEDIDKLVIKAIENDFNEKTIAQIVFLYFKNDKKIIDCYEKIRIGISEEIFNLFMNIADSFNDNAKNYDECSKEWRENKQMYVKIFELSLKLKDAKFKDKIMNSCIIKNKSL